MSNLKTLLTTWTINSPLFVRFVNLLQAIDAQAPDILRVLTYHRIDNPQNRPHLYPGLSIPPAAFVAQMEYLASSSYNPISAQDLLIRLTDPNPKPLPPRAVLVTFDDGYQDFKEYAWSILQRFAIPAILFVPTAFPDHPERPFWWDTLHHILTTTNKQSISTFAGDLPLTTPQECTIAYNLLRDFLTSLPHDETLHTVEQLTAALEVSPTPNNILSWEELRKLSAEGLAIGAHTQTHPRLDRITAQESKREITSSIQDLTENMDGSNAPLPIFAYPGGGVTDEIVHILDHIGIKAAFSTQRGINNLNCAHPLRLNRINVGQRTSIPVLRAQLLHRPARFFSNFF